VTGQILKKCPQGAALLVLFLLSSLCWSASLARLQSEKHIEISAELLPFTDIVVGQRTELVINIATDRWFTGGTRFEIPEVDGLVIIQTNNFASNSSENRKGQSWVIQRWSLDVFPQRSGTFTIPPINARLSVNDEAAGDVKGTLQSPSLTFQANVPAALAKAQHWVAAPDYKVSQSFDRELTGLKAGDAIERSVVFEASNVMAMMLPGWQAEDLSGLAVYPQPPSLSNSNNRGSMIAKRVEHITYIVEEPGQYQLPARDYYWWDTSEGELQIRFLPAVDITVGETAEKNIDTGQSKILANVSPGRLLIFSALFALFIGLCWFIYKRLPRIPLTRITGPIKRGWQHLQRMRKPALPSTLNPGSSAGE
jgi:hypothetical protein